ncbi:DUF2637 domain-containing protein [Streptomyces sp. NBC_00264]|uniref:DUF2637 domain-containing protein n=1 Tax=unclassified Streptomyces TaxID=2593676 RepID=UPI00224F97A4|nr:MULTISPECIES: DUF2637 domain-containing protein [unclassified Streptomyces]MCX5159979.1 DUF2637 domain-containing protein [Streptomyces sp. NBC_00305]MCX5218502.1 DUF2637 domain-containing protein [Streptomyces sp. NBC_00264]
MNRFGKGLLVFALVAVVTIAFRVSWNALRDVARAIGADSTAALLYPFVVDGLMALALVATLVLTDRADKRFALRVLAAYTIASLVLNYVHGLVPELHGGSADWGRLADWNPANWALVLLATSLPVGSIYFGSDLVAKVLHHRPIDPTPDTESADTTTTRSTADREESTPAPIAPVGTPPALPAPVVVDLTKRVEPVPVGTVAAESTRPRRATGRVPDAARSSRPVRTAEQLLDEARSATDDWSTKELTAEGIRKAVHTSPAKARVLRETLRAERAEHAVPEADQDVQTELAGAVA